MKLKQKMETFVQNVIDKVTGSGVMQDENTADGEKFIFEPMPPVALKSAEESIVLLKNDNNTLPLKKEQVVSVFGRCQIDYFYVGYGSGGDVNAPYSINLIEGLKNKNVHINNDLLKIYDDWCKDNPVNHGFWGHWPMNYPEMTVDSALVSKAGKDSDIALVVIGRAAGEDRENKLEKGSYYLTDEEINMLNLVTANFDKVAVIMNCGNIIDMSWLKKYGDKISSVIYAWQCGMESGNALANILTGAVTPSGKLTDTIAQNYADYPSADNFGSKKFNNYEEDIYVGYRYFETFCPDKVLYPFGFGLSYTEFEIEPLEFAQIDNKFNVSVKVKNIGQCDGKEVVQIYVNAPKGKLGKAEKSLVTFAKTGTLAPDEEEILNFSFSLYDIASFDDVGVTGNKFSYVLESGDYVFYAGNSVRTDLVCGKAKLDFTVIQTLDEVCGVKNSFSRIKSTDDGMIKELVEVSTPYLKKRIINNLPLPIGYKGGKANLSNVADGKITLDAFISTLTNDELETLAYGQGKMDSQYGVTGNAGAFGGTNKNLIDKGIKPIITTDGPAGIRIKKYTSLIPCGTALASTWNTDLVNELAAVMGQEMRYHSTDVLLAPGMNIHRDVLCGRNFEYFSEDPLVSGKMAAAFVNGIQSAGVSACPKHFACNNQEVSRTKCDSRLSQRALREIYLKGFEICVKDSSPLNIMTSYNKINGVWSHYNYDLVTTVLRKEWKYKGNVMTDWWMQKSASPEFPATDNNAYRIRAQVDVLMPGAMSRTGTYKPDKKLLKAVDTTGITRAELERTAKNVLKLVLKLKY